MSKYGSYPKTKMNHFFPSHVQVVKFILFSVFVPKRSPFTVLGTILFVNGSFQKSQTSDDRLHKMSYAALFPHADTITDDQQFCTLTVTIKILRCHQL